ncbi:MAG: alpha/beta hydrolase [Acidobacteriaceae bacterium]
MARYSQELHPSNKRTKAVSDPRDRNVTPHQDPTHQLDHAEIVSGRWLVKAILSVLAAAGVALYFTVCLLFYQGQWQFTFFPPKTLQPDAATVAANSGLPITEVRFDTTDEGLERLDGWWIPAPSSATSPLSQFVILFCPNGHTDLPDNVDALKALHALGVNVFAFDYQGFGKSQAGHPSQQKAYANGVAALNYLTGLRHFPADRVVIYGPRLGAAVAAHAAHTSPKIAGLILEDPQPSLTGEVKREQHIHLLPMWLIFQDRFDISGIVPSLSMPKLILSTPPMRLYSSSVAQVYNDATAPKEQAAITEPSNQSVYALAEWRTAVGNFLNSVAEQPSNRAGPPGTLK